MRRWAAPRRHLLAPLLAGEADLPGDELGAVRAAAGRIAWALPALSGYRGQELTAARARLAELGVEGEPRPPARGG